MRNADAFSNYRFVLSMENSAQTGYISEKIFIGFLSGAIPIYSGTELIFDIFNKDAFIFWNVKQPQISLQQIEYLESNRTAYDEMRARPFLVDGVNTMDQYFIYGNSKARHRVLTALEMVTPSGIPTQSQHLPVHLQLPSR